jgi:hypothetical protein
LRRLEEISEITLAFLSVSWYILRIKRPIYGEVSLLLCRSDVDNTARKQRAGFKRGQSGNPAGRPKGARNRATLAAEALLQGEAEEITRTCIERAKTGDSVALRLAMERILPPTRERAICVDLPSVASVADLPAALGRILAAVAAGEILPAEGQTLCTMVAAQRQAFETVEIADRLAELERRLAQASRHE